VQLASCSYGPPWSSGRRFGPNSQSEPVQVKQLTGELSGQPVLWTSGTNYTYEATALMAFPDALSLRFPVYGRTPRNAIMAAVDESEVRHVLFTRRKSALSSIRPMNWTSTVRLKRYEMLVTVGREGDQGPPSNAAIVRDGFVVVGTRPAA
jgi:hypothetical protein